MSLSKNTAKIILDSRFSLNSMMILSIFVDAKSESLYGENVKERFKHKFNFDIKNNPSALLKTFSERGFLKIDEIKNANPEFQGRGNYRKYYFATEEAEEVIDFLRNLSSK